jgi:hypothetical protein
MPISEIRTTARYVSGWRATNVRVEEAFWLGQLIAQGLLEICSVQADRRMLDANGPAGWTNDD